MAAGDSIVGICNIALTALGETPIVALTDPNKRAILCNTRYNDVRRAVLRSHPWNCARKADSLAPSPSPPPDGFNYSYAYQLPADFLRMAAIPLDDLARWDIVGDQLLTNDGPALTVTYIFDLQDPTKFDPLLVQAIAYSLAAELCEPLTQSGTKLQLIERKLQDKMGDARTVGSQENSPKPWDVDVWLRRRF